jgi:XTP/dITP diphosphohydrolase
MQLLIGTGNAGKVREFAALLADLPWTIVTPDALGIDEDVAETGTTFAENALLKATWYARRSGLVTLADDSGLEVAALDGAPGVYSARFAGPGASDADRNALLLERLRDVPWHARLARFVCCIAIVAPDGRSETVTGVLSGVIERAPRGSGGFGYDPLFYVLDDDATLAELPAARKHAISHRARAAAAACEVLRRWTADGQAAEAEEDRP